MARTKKVKGEVVWNYLHDADITIGEKKISKAPKILLALLVMLIVAAAVAGYYFKDVIYDFIVKPQVWLTEPEVDLEFGSDFVPEDYIYRLPGNGEQTDRYEITIPSPEDVDTKKLGTYRVVYKVKLANETENISELTVNVVDTQPPVIELTDSEIELTREVDSFKCTAYIKSVKDNYDKKVEATCHDNIDWNQDTVEVSYLSTDSSDNIGTANLTIKIKDKPQPSYICWDGSKAWSSEECPVKPQTNANEQGQQSQPVQQPQVDQSQNSGESYTYTEQPVDNGGAIEYSEGGYTSGESYIDSSASGPSIVGAHDISVPVGTSGSEILNSLAAGVTSGNGSQIIVDISGVNSASPGVYSATITASDGSSQQVNVTIE